MLKKRVLHIFLTSSIEGHIKVNFTFSISEWYIYGIKEKNESF